MTLIRRLLWFCTICALAADLAGCSAFAKAVLAPRPDITQFYLLTPTVDSRSTTAASTPATADFTLGLGQVKLPPYLDRPEVVTRVAPNRLELSKTERWGESLQNGFTSVLERDLAVQTGTQKIVVYPWYNTTHIDLQVQIDVYRFETDGNGNAQLSARWTILDASGKSLYGAESNLTQTYKPGDTTDAAAALSRTVGDLSGQIANMIQQVRSQQGTHPA